MRFTCRESSTEHSAVVEIDVQFEITIRQIL